MDRIINISEDIYWVGVNDRETHLFEALWPLPKGVAYNSYVVLDEKVALIDTVKAAFTFDFLEKIQSLLRGRKVDYLVINHMEPDHSGAIQAVLSAFPDIQIVCNSKTTDFLKGFYNITENLRIMEDGGTLDLGKHRLRFFLTPMVHWPETMMTYEETEKILFAGDAFGGFGALDGGIFDDQINIAFYQEEIRRYYTNIVAKYHPMVVRAIDKLKNLDIGVVAATHGPIWRTNPQKIIEDYNCWSKCHTEPGVVIAYGTMYGHTKIMAEKLAKDLAGKGLRDIKVYDVSKTHLSYIFNDIWRYRVFILGSCTYNTGLFPPMAQLLDFIRGSRLKNHMMGIFGTYSWSGGAVKALSEFGRSGMCQLIEPVVEVKHAPEPADLEKCARLVDNIIGEMENG